MSLLDAIRLALTQIKVQKLKSFFTLLGVTIGVMFLIAVVSIVNGMSKYMEEDFAGEVSRREYVHAASLPRLQHGRRNGGRRGASGSGVRRSRWRMRTRCVRRCRRRRGGRFRT